MYLIDIGWEVAKWIWEHRDNAITWGAFLALLGVIAEKFGRKLITNQIKRLFHVRDKSDFALYVADQKRLESKVDMLLNERGLKWDVPLSHGKPEQSETDGQTRNSSSSRAGLWRVRIIGSSIQHMKETYQLSRRFQKMKSKLLSRKLGMTILGSVILVLNQQMGWELNAESIIGIGSLFISFILGQSVVDTNGMGQFAPFFEKLKSSKLWVALIGSVLIVINDEYKWGMTSDNIYIIVGLAVSFILGKSAVSVVQASKNMEVNNAESHSDTEHAV